MIENDRINWRNAFISSIIVSLGSPFVILAQGSFRWEVYAILLPFLWLFIFSPVLFIELISRIQKIIERRKEEK